MWNEKTYSSDEIIKKYKHVIERVLRDHIMEEHDSHIKAIDVICRAIRVEYDWKNSPEGFRNWLLRMTKENHISSKICDALMKHWIAAEKADNEWKSVYYGMR